MFLKQINQTLSLFPLFSFPYIILILNLWFPKVHEKIIHSLFSRKFLVFSFSFSFLFNFFSFPFCLLVSWGDFEKPVTKFLKRVEAVGLSWFGAFYAFSSPDLGRLLRPLFNVIFLLGMFWVHLVAGKMQEKGRRRSWILLNCSFSGNQSNMKHHLFFLSCLGLSQKPNQFQSYFIIQVLLTSIGGGKFDSYRLQL